jgi:lysophospholipase L1-like esterase
MAGRNPAQVLTFIARILIALPALCVLLAWVAAEEARRIVIVGDSTVMTYKESDFPQCGWGQELGHFFRDGAVAIDNRAIGGRSSRSFIEEGRWATVSGTLRKGDFVLIQFGHNDRSTVAERHADTAQFRKYLTQYVTESRARGAIPILVSPMNMNAWTGATLREVFNEGANDYYTAMGRVVKALDVPFVDLEKKSHAYFQKLGQDYITKYLFLGLDAGEYPNFPDGIADGTHFQEMGAISMARFVAEGIGELKSHPDVGPLASLLAPLYPLTVTSNKSSGGTVTVNGNYPAHAPITLKARPRTGETFQGWQSAGGGAAVNQKRHSFAMPAEPVSYFALFQGGTTRLGNEIREASKENPVAFDLGSGDQCMVQAMQPIQSLKILGLQGQTLYRSTPHSSRAIIPHPAGKAGKGKRILALRFQDGSLFQTWLPESLDD